MTTAISSISNGASAPTFDPAKGASRFAAKVFGDLDADKDGKLSKTEFVSGLQSKGVSADDAAKQFDAIDTQKTGSITQSDLETAVKSGKFGPPAGARGAGGGAPAGGPHGGGRPEGAGGAGGAGSASSSTKTHEAADTNKDGTVSAEEQLVYSISHPSAEATSTDASKLGTKVDETA
jgi:Ca2+-binding EF-hand superfamily protein